MTLPTCNDEQKAAIDDAKKAYFGEKKAAEMAAAQKILDDEAAAAAEKKAIEDAAAKKILDDEAAAAAEKKAIEDAAAQKKLDDEAKIEAKFNGLKTLTDCDAEGACADDMSCGTVVFKGDTVETDSRTEGCVETANCGKGMPEDEDNKEGLDVGDGRLYYY